MPVFDVSMTDPLPGKEPVPLAPPSQPISGDSHHHLIAPLVAHAAELGYRVEIRELPDEGPGGWCDPERHEIVVADGPANRIVRTLVHELAHAHGLGYADYGREQAEVLVDCVTYCVLGSVGLDVGGESIPYVAGWGEDGALDAIKAYANTIDSVARRIEDALQPRTETVDGPRDHRVNGHDGRRACESAPPVQPIATVPDVPLPGLDVAAIRHYCEQRVPPHALDQVRIEADVDARAVTVVECRAPWREDCGLDWTRRGIARFRWTAKHQHWTLYWSDRDQRWHLYDLVEPTRDIRQLLDELDRDPTCIFWG